jgi:hypothetical protein
VAEPLDGLAGVTSLRAVHADQADGYPLAVEADDDGIAINDPFDDGDGNRG